MAADKGGSVVLMDVWSHKQKVMELLYDNETYERQVTDL